MDGTARLTELNEQFIEAFRQGSCELLEASTPTATRRVISGRTSRQAGSYRCYLDSCDRRAEGWRCVHACVWPVQAAS